jgi:hypothetical protein
MFILSLFSIGFSHLFYCFSYLNDEENQFAGKEFISALEFTFNILAGNVDTEKVGIVVPRLVSFCIITFSIFGYFIMMNSLISIMSNTFSQVYSLKEINTYR